MPQKLKSFLGTIKKWMSAERRYYNYKREHARVIRIWESKLDDAMKALDRMSIHYDTIMNQSAIWEAKYELKCREVLLLREEIKKLKRRRND